MDKLWEEHTKRALQMSTKMSEAERRQLQRKSILVCDSQLIDVAALEAIQEKLDAILAILERYQHADGEERNWRDLVKELDVTNELLTERNRILEAIPPCQSHGSQCVPHALQWIEEARRLMKENGREA